MEGGWCKKLLKNLELSKLVCTFAPRWELHIGAMTSSSATVDFYKAVGRVPTALIHLWWILFLDESAPWHLQQNDQKRPHDPCLCVQIDKLRNEEVWRRHHGEKSYLESLLQQHRQRWPQWVQRAAWVMDRFKWRMQRHTSIFSRRIGWRRLWVKKESGSFVVRFLFRFPTQQR